MNTVQYLAAVKQKLEITTDYALAKALNVRKQTVAKWQTGLAVPGPLTAFKIAEILGEQPAGVIAELEQERAERDQVADEADAWKGYAQRFGGRLAALGATILVAAGMGGFSNADARLARSADSATSYTSYASC